jgi:hypothetical protein
MKNTQLFLGGDVLTAEPLIYQIPDLSYFAA